MPSAIPKIVTTTVVAIVAINTLSRYMRCNASTPPPRAAAEAPHGADKRGGTLNSIVLLAMPAKSKKQQMAAGAALAAKRGESSKSKLKGASPKMADSMSEGELADLATTKRKKLPTRKV